MDICSLMDSIRPYIPATNELYRNYYINRYLTYSHHDTIVFTVQRNDEPVRIKERTYFLFKNQPGFEQSVKFLQPGIGYIYPAGIPSPEAVPEIFLRFEDTKAIILDLRCYPKSSVTDKIFTYIDYDYENFRLHPVVQPDLSSPGRFYWKPNLGGWKKRMTDGRKPDKKYKGKIVLLVDETTISFAETLTMMFKEMDIPVIGRTTAGANGNVSVFSLPGGINMFFSGVGIASPDSMIVQGVDPDIAVYPTIESLRDHEDEILQKALLFLNPDKPDIQG